MAYVDIPSADLDPESPIDTDLMTALARNPEMIAQGDSAVPNGRRLKGMAQEDATSGNYVEAQTSLVVTVEGGSYAATLAKIFCPRAGNYNVRVELSATSTSGTTTGYAKIYRNGSAVGTERSITTAGGGSPTSNSGSWDEDITVTAGQWLEVYTYNGSNYDYGSTRLTLACANPFIPGRHING